MNGAACPPRPARAKSGARVTIAGGIAVAGRGWRRSPEDARVSLGRTQVDLTRVTFVDSSGLNDLLRVVNDGHHVKIRGAIEPVRRVFELVGLDSVFELER